MLPLPKLPRNGSSEWGFKADQRLHLAELLADNRSLVMTSGKVGGLSKPYKGILQTPPLSLPNFSVVILATIH